MDAYKGIGAHACAVIAAATAINPVKVVTALLVQRRYYAALGLIAGDVGDERLSREHPDLFPDGPMARVVRPGSAAECLLRLTDLSAREVASVLATEAAFCACVGLIDEESAHLTAREVADWLSTKELSWVECNAAGSRGVA